MKFRIDTDRFIVCGVCTEAEHFGNVTVAKARELAALFGGWSMKDGAPICADCQEREREAAQESEAAK